MIARGGKPIYGAPVGILMLEAQFPRIPGDMGNATTWPFPVLYSVVEGADPDRVVRRGAPGLLDQFITAGRDLIRQGAEVITTNCGFLGLFQAELAAALRVPVATTALMQVPMVKALLPQEQRVGVITISAATLTKAHLVGAGCPTDVPIVGTEDGQEFSRAILGNAQTLDIAAARHDLCVAARRLIAEHANIGAIVLECTNMPPYQADIRAVTGVPVFSMVDYVCWLQASVSPKRWGLYHGTVGA